MLIGSINYVSALLFFLLLGMVVKKRVRERHNANRKMEILIPVCFMLSCCLLGKLVHPKCDSEAEIYT